MQIKKWEQIRRAGGVEGGGPGGGDKYAPILYHIQYIYLLFQSVRLYR